MAHMIDRFLLYFAQEHVKFRLPELQAVAALRNIKLTLPPAHDERRPFLPLTLKNENAARHLASRCISVRSLFELWAEAESYEELYKQLRNIPRQYTDQFTSIEKSFRFVIDSFNKVTTQEEKIKIIEDVLEHGIDFQGPVKMKNADHVFHILEDYGVEETLPEPRRIYFGRWLMDGQRDTIRKYDLKKRKFIGNTSMEAGLSLLMANMAQVQPGSLVIDPFVGTGSLLVSSAHYGAYVMGTEIDRKLLHGIGRASRAGVKWRSRDENVRNNLAQYGLQTRYIDVIAADSSKPALWRQTHSLYDAIITDPPYGIRESSRKTGDNESESSNQGSDSNNRQYHISSVFTDLLNFSALYLRVGGRLVYWYPVYKPEFTEACIPCHPCLTRCAACEQPLNTKVSRLLITMQKHVHPQEESDLNGAYIPVDPFENETFRDKYFGPEVIAKEHSNKAESKSPKHSKSDTAQETLVEDSSVYLT